MTRIAVSRFGAADLIALRIALVPAPSSRLPVAIVGATGVAGGQALVALKDHPWFEVVRVGASATNAGRRLGDVLASRRVESSAASRANDELALDLWPDDDAVGAATLDLVLEDATTMDVSSVAVVFSMLPTSTAAELEARFAVTTPVFSTAAAFRDEPDTPLLMAGVNPIHSELLETQARARGWRGFVAPGPNCTTVGLAVSLAPLATRFGIEAVHVTSMQAISGAGMAGVALADAVRGNVLPFIADEEAKVERELRKIFGGAYDGMTVPARFGVSATCTRVPVCDGHTLSVGVTLSARRADLDELRLEALEAWRDHNPWARRKLPSLPERWIDVLDDGGPEPRRDVTRGGGMTTVVGRVRTDPVLGGLKYVALSHNTVLGAAGGSVLLAEDLLDRGVFTWAG